MLSTRETAAALGITPRAVVRRVTAGTLTPIHKNPGYRGDYLFLEEDIQAIAADEATQSRETPAR